MATTGNDANAGTSGSPWRNPHRCAKFPIAPGDTCIVRAGIYQPSDIGRNDITIYIAASQGSIAGSAGNPITIKSEVPLGAVIRVRSVNAGSAGIYVAQPYYIIEGFDINGSDTVWNTGLSASAAGVTVAANNVTVRKNHIWDIARTLCSDVAFGQSGMLVTNNTQNTVIEYNQFNKIGRLRNGENGCVTTHYQHDHGIYEAGGDFTTIRKNIFYDVNRGYAITVYANGTIHDNVAIINNTFSGSSPTGQPFGQLSLCNTLTNVSVKNNIFHNPPNGYVIEYCAGTTASNVSVSNNIQNLQDADGVLDMQNAAAKPASGVTNTGNIFNATLGLKNTVAGSEDLTLTSSSAAINAGVNVGLLYNGAAPDMGAFETVVFSVCTATASTKIQVAYTNNAAPPLLPVSGITTFTARKNTVSNPLSGSGVAVSDNVVELTVTNAQAGGDTVDISLATTNLTDSSLIGGSKNQPIIQTLTNQSCTNAISGASYTLTQAAFEFHDAFGTESSPTILPLGWASTGAAENLSISYPVYGGGKLRIRFAVVCGVAACPDAGYLIYYSRNAGAYTQLPDAAGSDGVQTCGIIAATPINGSPTTNQLSTAGTFVPGGIVYTSNAIPVITGFGAGNKTELEYCVKYTTGASGTYDFRVYVQSGSALNTYSFTPRNLIVNPAFWSF